MKEITTEMYEALKRPLPAEAVSPHPTKSFLSTIKAIYVTERLNEVFGVGKWSVKTDMVTTQGKMVVCKTILEIPDYGVYYESFGGNDNADLGDAYKGATTDAITKIGSYLGIAIDVFKGIKDKSPQSQQKKEIGAVQKQITEKQNSAINEEELYKVLSSINNINEVQSYLAMNKIDIKSYPSIRQMLNDKFSKK